MPHGSLIPYGKLFQELVRSFGGSKIHFTYKIDDLETFIGRNYIPKSLGGDDTFKMTYVKSYLKECSEKTSGFSF